MSKTVINLIIVLAVVTVAFAGYYLFKQQQETDLFGVNTGTEVTEDMLNRTRAFIGYGGTLEKIKLDVSIFTSNRFTTLRSYSTEFETYREGRSNPFSETQGVVPPR